MADATLRLTGFGPRAWWQRTSAQVGLGIIAVLLLLAAFAPIVTRYDPARQDDVVRTRFQAPGATDADGNFHLLGTDRFGRDVWTRLVYGARISLATGTAATLIAVLLGVLVGTVAGVWRGRIGLLLLGVTDFALALPRVVLLLLLAALWQPSALLVVIVLGVTGWMGIARLVYAESRAIMARPFTTAAGALGAGRWRIALHHVLPNVWTPVTVAAALGVGNAITLEAGLSFLGLGVQPPAPSWGGMIASGRDTIVNAPWVAIAPGAALVLTVVACTLVGDALRDRAAGRG